MNVEAPGMVLRSVSKFEDPHLGNCAGFDEAILELVLESLGKKVQGLIDHVAEGDASAVAQAVKVVGKLKGPGRE